MYLWTIRQKGMGFSLKTWWSIEQCSIHKKKSIWELAHDIDFFLWMIYGESRIWARSGADCECCIAKSAWVYSQAGLLFLISIWRKPNTEKKRSFCKVAWAKRVGNIGRKPNTKGKRSTGWYYFLDLEKVSLFFGWKSSEIFLKFEFCIIF